MVRVLFLGGAVRFGRGWLRCCGVGGASSSSSAGVKRKQKQARTLDHENAAKELTTREASCGVFTQPKAVRSQVGLLPALNMGKVHASYGGEMRTQLFTEARVYE